MDTNHTHELRLHDYTKGLNHIQVLVKGTEEDCLAYLEIEAKRRGCGIGLLVNNGGYTVVDLAAEVIAKKKAAGVELFDALQILLEEAERVAMLVPSEHWTEDFRAKWNANTLIAEQAIQKATE